MPSSESVIKQIQTTGERMTIQRRLIVEALCAAEGHLSISDLQQWLQATYPAHGLSDATIYRILQWLKNIGFVSQTDMGNAGIVYELLGQSYHHHLICLNCGRVIDVEDRYLASLRQALSDDFSFLARIDHMAIYGLCQECAAKQADTNVAQAH